MTLIVYQCGTYIPYYTVLRYVNMQYKCQRWAGKLYFKSASRKSAYSWTHSVRCASPQITNPQTFMIHKFLQTGAQFHHITVLIVVFIYFLYEQFESEHHILYLSEKKYLFADLRKLSPQIARKIGHAFVEGSQI
jgi:hypothetical protein